MEPTNSLVFCDVKELTKYGVPSCPPPAPGSRFPAAGAGGREGGAGKVGAGG